MEDKNAIFGSEKNPALRWVLGIIILIAVFVLGIKFGQYTIYFGGSGYGGMMGGYYPNEYYPNHMMRYRSYYGNQWQYGNFPQSTSTNNQ